ncbi:MAG TPA: PEP-CTERM sorting domain-containing protein [Pyrinomonadaceae bacterium]|jgi:PEP-CTERM putative exosortase interaction domain|nr:PEP-CTERM sorting domain-containing protein [Pyrinomonadaceae bacterium]
MFTQPHGRIGRKIFSTATLGILFFFAGVNAVFADEIAIWNFNDSDLVVDHGTGTLTSNFVSSNILFAAGTTNNARLGDLAGQALSLQGGTSNTNNGRNLTFNVSTVGFSNIIFSFATQGTSTGFNSNQFQYSLDGTNFIDFGSPYVPATAFGSVPLVFTLTSIVGLNNNPNATFRIVFNGATTSTGNNRIDNIVIDGTSSSTGTIPEPTTALLLFSGLSGLIAIKRKRRSVAD